MRLQPPVDASDPDVAVIDARAAFGLRALPGAGHAAFCRSCGSELVISGGLVDAGMFRHRAGCRIGNLTTAAVAAGKPVLLRCRSLEVRN
jgi:hypothetical protein